MFEAEGWAYYYSSHQRNKCKRSIYIVLVIDQLCECFIPVTYNYNPFITSRYKYLLLWVESVKLYRILMERVWKLSSVKICRHKFTREEYSKNKKSTINYYLLLNFLCLEECEVFHIQKEVGKNVHYLRRRKLKECCNDRLENKQNLIRNDRVTQINEAFT